MPVVVPAATEKIKRSGRLAAELPVGRSVMDKVKFALLRKCGVMEEEGPLTKNSLKKCTVKSTRNPSHNSSSRQSALSWRLLRQTRRRESAPRLR